MRTYDDLINDVRTFLNRKDLEEQIPRFIMLAESDLFRRLRATCNELLVTYDEVSSGYPIIGAIRLPDSCIELKSVIVDGAPLQFVSDAEYFRRLANEPPQSRDPLAGEDPSYWISTDAEYPSWLLPLEGQVLAGTGKPEVFTRIQNYICYHPVSDKRNLIAYLSMYHYDLLDSVNYQTYTLQDGYNAYLYGALSHAEGYLMNDPRIALWKSKFEECLGQLNGTKTDSDLGSVQEVNNAYA